MSCFSSEHFTKCSKRCATCISGELPSEQGARHCAVLTLIFLPMGGGGGGGKISNMLAKLNYIGHRRPDVIRLDIGTNDMASGANPHALALEIRGYAMCLLRQVYCVP